MARREKIVGDREIWAELSEFIIIELPSVVQDNNLGNPKSVDDIFSYEIFGISFYDFGERFRFYPFGKVINGDDQEFYL